MKKMKFIGLVLAFSFLFVHFTQAQTTVNRIAGGTTNAATVSLCNSTICLTPWNYPAPGSHTFAMPTNSVIHIVVGYVTGNFDVLRSTVDGASGFYPLSNGTNTLLIRKVSFGVYEFFII